MDTPATEKALRQMAEQLARLIEISVTLNSTLDEKELLQFIIGTAAELLGCESVSILPTAWPVGVISTLPVATMFPLYCP